MTSSPFSATNVSLPLTASLLFTAAYLLMHVLVEGLVTRPLLVGRWSSRNWKELTGTERAYLTGKILSTINALTVGLSVVYFLFWQPHFLGTEGIFRSYPPTMTLVFSSYVGYTLYDMLLMAGYVSELEHWTMWMHHIIGLFGAFLMMLYRQAAYFPVFFLISELSVPSTNWVWMLRTLHAPKYSLHYRLAHGIRSLSFVAFRSFLAPLCLWYAWQQVAPGYEASYKWTIFLREVGKLPWIITAGTSFNMCFLGMLNIWWTVVMGMGVLFPKKGDMREEKKNE